MNCFLQLLYEFNKVCGEDVVGAMEKNWQRVCQTLLPDCDDLTPANERKVLQIVEKNIYHKKPQILPITLAIVSLTTEDSKYIH